MSNIELLDFQQEAASKLVKAAVSYFANGQDVVGGRPIPFVGQLQAVTGAGKTPIIADVVGRLKPAIVLWTTKFGSVVDQTVANLRGKYRHLLGKSGVEIINFSEITSASQWEYIIERTDGLTVLVSTVAMWNSSEKDAPARACIRACRRAPDDRAARGSCDHQGSGSTARPLGGAVSS